MPGGSRGGSASIHFGISSRSAILIGPCPGGEYGEGVALANARHVTRALQDWLGHRSIQHTVRYTELSPTRFKDFWRTLMDFRFVRKL